MVRLEDGWVEDLLHHLTSCDPCQQYWDSYMQRVRELDSVEARYDRDVMLEVLVGGVSGKPYRPPSTYVLLETNLTNISIACSQFTIIHNCHFL